MARARTLAEAYRRFAETEAAGTSPLHQRVARAVSASGEALRMLEAASARARRPAVVLAALHDLALAGRSPTLAAAYEAGNPEAAAAAAIDTLLAMVDAVVALAARRKPVTDSSGRCAVLSPALAEAARRAGADALGLVAVGSPAGFDLLVDRVGITYGPGPTLGDPSSPVQLSPSVVGGCPVPSRAVPDVVARVLVGAHPLDVTDPDDARWLRACVAPDEPQRAARLEAEIALAGAARPLLLRGGPVDLLLDAVAQVPTRALPVVTTTWALSRLPPADRSRFLSRLQKAAASRPLAWVSAEGVGVAPGIPTLGDRPASGHSIIGLAVFDGSSRTAEALGRCWSRGRLLSWLA